MAKTSLNTCARCGATFACGMETGQEVCWCAELPALQVPLDAAQGCYCPACLRQLIAAQAEQSGSS